MVEYQLKKKKELAITNKKAPFNLKKFEVSAIVFVFSPLKKDSIVNSTLHVKKPVTT
jgi:hypothetical protein